MLVALLPAFWLLCLAAALGAWRSQPSWMGVAASGWLTRSDPGEFRAQTLGRAVATATVAFGLVAWLTPNTLSLWNGLTAPSVAAVWLVACLVVIVLFWRYIVIGWEYAADSVRQVVAWARADADRADTLGGAAPKTGDAHPTPPAHRALTFVWGATIALMMSLTLAAALLYPPTVWDSFSHHLPRIVQFIQNQTVAPFPTYYPSMNSTYPFTSYVNTQATLLAGSTDMLNLGQWFAYVGSAVLIYAITKMLGGSSTAARFAMLFGLTAPSVALQASSSQYDLVAAVWCLTTVLLVLAVRSHPEDRRATFVLAGLLGVALGLGAVTKITFVVLVAPYCLWLVTAFFRSAGLRATVVNGAFTLLVALLIYSPWLAQNLAQEAGPLGTASPGNSFMLVKDQSIGPLGTNAVRNLSMQLATPSTKINEVVEYAASIVVLPFGVPIDSPVNKELVERPYGLPTTNFNPDTAASPVTAIVFVLAVLALLLSERGTVRSTTLAYLACGVTGVLIIAAYVTWQPFITRSLGSGILVLSPVAGVGAVTLVRKGAWVARILRPLAGGLLVLATAYCILAIVFSATQPLANRAIITGQDRNGYWNLAYHDRGWQMATSYLQPDVAAIREIAAGSTSTPAPIALIGGDKSYQVPVYPLIRELRAQGFTIVYEPRFGPGELPGVIGESPAYASAQPAVILSYDSQGDAGSVHVGALPAAQNPAYKKVHERYSTEMGLSLSIYVRATASEVLGRE